MAASSYQVISKEVENHIFRYNWVFRRICIYKQPTLTKWWNYNIFLQIWYSYLKYTGWLFLECALLLAHCNIIRVSWETKKERLTCRKKYIGEFAWRTSLFGLHAFLSFSVAFFVFSFPFSNWSTCWMAPIKIHNIAMVGILHDDTMSEWSKIISRNVILF